MLEAILADVHFYLDGMGAWAYVAAPLFVVVVALLPIPGEAAAMINGALFGPWVGTAITWTGALAGALLTFEISRALGRPLAERFVSPEMLAKADRLVDGAGGAGLLVVRFIPLAAFKAINWGAGLTPVSRWTFAWTTAVGILPGVFVFTASGAGMSFLLTEYPWATGIGVTVVMALLLLWLYRLSLRRAEAAELAESPTGVGGTG